MIHVYFFFLSFFFLFFCTARGDIYIPPAKYRGTTKNSSSPTLFPLTRLMLQAVMNVMNISQYFIDDLGI